MEAASVRFRQVHRDAGVANNERVDLIHQVLEVMNYGRDDDSRNFMRPRIAPSERIKLS